jgi:hypothetical protein
MNIQKSFAESIRSFDASAIGPGIRSWYGRPAAPEDADSIYGLHIGNEIKVMLAR